MRAEEIRKGDQLVRESDGWLFWTALDDAMVMLMRDLPDHLRLVADDPQGLIVAVLVQHTDGGREPRYLPFGRELPIRRPGSAV